MGGIALKLAEGGAQVPFIISRNSEAAQATLEKIRALAPMDSRPGRCVQIRRGPPPLSASSLRVRSLDVLVSNARPEASMFYEAPMDITLDKWDTAMDSQAKAFLVAVREAAPLMSHGGRIIAISFAPGGRFGSWQPWVAMGAAKAAMEVLVRYFAVALAQRGITVNTISPGWVEDSVLNSLPEAFKPVFANGKNAAGPQWAASEHLRTSATRSHYLFTRSSLDYRPVDRCGRRRIPGRCPPPLGIPGIAKAKTTSAA